MPRYWVMAPVDSKPPERFNKVWQFDLANDLVSIGWHDLGDVTKLSREELTAAVAATYPDKPLSTKSLYTNMLWQFYHEMRPGDVVVARRGRKILAAVGAVTEPAIYSPGRVPSVNHIGVLGVAWQDAPRDRAFPNIVFPMHTLMEITQEAFRKLVDGPGVADAEPPAVSPSFPDQTEFVLEKYLEEFIVSNFDKIFRGELKIYQDEEGNDGQQYDTDIGPIDILATETRSKSFVVIELKKGRSSDEVVGQVMRYMGWVKKNLCGAGEEVRGLVICREPDPRLTYALEVASNINARYYQVAFSLSELP